MYTRVVDYLRTAELRPLLAVFFFLSLPFTLYTTMFAFFAKNQLSFKETEAGYFLALVGLSWASSGRAEYEAIIVQTVRRIQIANDRCLVASAAGAGVLRRGRGRLVEANLVAILFSFGHSVSRPSLTSLIAQAAPPNRRGGVFDAMTSIESVTHIIGPVLGGWIITTQPRWLGWVGGALFTVAALIGLTIRSSEARYELLRCRLGQDH